MVGRARLVGRLLDFRNRWIPPIPGAYKQRVEPGPGVKCTDRAARPEEVADLVRYLATTDAEFLTGGIIDLNGASYLRS